MPIAIEQHNLSAYDLIISSSHAVAKGVLTGPNQLHICYCHSPIRYAWDLQHQYLHESNMSSGIKSLLSRYILHKMRIWDYRTANGVDFFVSNSKFISRRIKKIYGKSSTVIYPPINTENYYFEETSDKEFYVTCSRLVQYKKIDLIVDTFTKKFPDKDLLIIGDGPEFKKIKSKAGSNVKLVGKKSDSYLRRKLSGAKAFIFAAEEDFGIVPLEAQSCGTPVIAYGKGGALETVIGLDRENPTGVFFRYQSIESLEDAVLRFEKKSHLFKKDNCVKNAKKFNNERFRNEFKNYVDSKLINLQ
jgi:glycosyltransferase involved in cell wall biosynthesis